MLGNEKCGSWSESPKFIGGKDEYLSKIQLTDHWDRLDCAFSTEYAYRRTDDEMMEMADLLSVQKDINKWREIKKDPEKMAYYESAFKEMAMKNYEAIYASIVRMSQTIGMHALLLHPVDLMLQANITFKRLLQANVVITNITQKNNPELIKKLFDENNKDGRYICDVDDLVFLGDAFSTINFKLTSNYNMVNSIYRDVVDRYTDEDYFGYDVIDAAEKEQEKLVEELNKEGKTKEADEINKRDKEEMMNWYISMHPELFSEENLLRKDGDGSYVLQNDMVDGIGKMINTGGGILNQLIKSDKVQKFSEEELRKYENSLKKRKFFALRWQDAKQFMDEVKQNITDKENSIKKCEKEIKDLKNSQQMDEKQKETIAYNEKEILKLQEDLKSDQALLKYYEKFEEKFENDPYALNMFKDGLEELKYKDDKGQEHFIDAQAIFKDLYQ
ncbi:MAG: hypothetical protein K6E91_14655 [Butyrivibrio sp.]|nr:hypothetical protein [Butyrivibrio sp.]